MSPEQIRFLSVCEKIDRYTFEQAGWRLNASEEEVAAWVRAGVLPVLGNPPKNGRKFVARTAVEALAADEKKLARASDASVKHWRRRNQRNEWTVGSGSRFGDSDVFNATAHARQHKPSGGTGSVADPECSGPIALKKSAPDAHHSSIPVEAR